MGKSPGKWIKGILFGKKTSKSNIPKGRVLSKSASERPQQSSSKEPIAANLLLDEPLISGPVSGSNVAIECNNTGFERKEGLLNDEKVDQNGDVLKVTDSSVEQKNQLEEAAITTLQAAVRGHLVRKQAVATLYCVQGIVKFQALARGHMVRQSSSGIAQCRGKTSIAKDVKISGTCEITKHVQASRLLKNAFIYKLCCSSPSVMPLRLEYDQGEPNSAWNWLIRWSTLQVFVPDSKPKQVCELKHDATETESSKNVRNDDPNHANHEKQNVKRNTKKHSTQPSKPARENGQSGNDKVKHDKKLAKPAREVSTEDEIEVEKPGKPSKSATPNFPEQNSNAVMDKPVEEDTQKAVFENGGVKSGVDEHVLENSTIVHLSSGIEHLDLVSDKAADKFPVKEELKEDEISIVSQKSNRRASLPAMHDADQYKTPESVTKLPSYMQTTASRKAKVKTQVSPRLGLDKNSLERRLSLPSSINGKMSSSPRVQKLVQGSNREGIKIDRSLSSSRDVTGKVIQVDWKR